MVKVLFICHGRCVDYVEIFLFYAFSEMIWTIFTTFERCSDMINLIFKMQR